MTVAALAYCAGIIDGEGYIGIKRSKAYKFQGRATPAYRARVQIRMTEESALAFLSERLGGWYYKDRQPIPTRKPLFCYQASDAAAERLLNLVRPYLLVKAQVADVVLSLRRLQAESGHRTKITGYRQIPHWAGKTVTMPNLSFTDEYVARCETLYHEAKRLNAVGVKGERDERQDPDRGCTHSSANAA